MSIVTAFELEYTDQVQYWAV